LGKRLEFQGLVIMIWGATVPLTYYAFVCDADLRVSYWIVTSLAALFCTIVNLQPSFSKSKLYLFQGLGLGFLALSFFIPVVHSLALYGLAVQTRRLGLQCIVYTLICHTFSAAAYATDVSASRMPD
jgi:adiponectin receptor